MFFVFLFFRDDDELEMILITFGSVPNNGKEEEGEGEGEGEGEEEEEEGEEKREGEGEKEEDKEKEDREDKEDKEKGEREKLIEIVGGLMEMLGEEGEELFGEVVREVTGGKMGVGALRSFVVMMDVYCCGLVMEKVIKKNARWRWSGW